jgi:hypothetical protein
MGIVALFRGQSPHKTCPEVFAVRRLSVEAGDDKMIDNMLAEISVRNEDRDEAFDST